VDSLKKIGDRKRAFKRYCDGNSSAGGGTNSNHYDRDHHDDYKNNGPWMLFLYAGRALATNEKYIQRLLKFLNFLGYEAWKEEKKKYHMRQDW
jgi:hypothetical protein